MGPQGTLNQYKGDPPPLQWAVEPRNILYVNKSLQGDLYVLQSQ